MILKENLSEQLEIEITLNFREFFFKHEAFIFFSKINKLELFYNYIIMRFQICFRLSKCCEHISLSIIYSIKIIDKYINSIIHK